MPSPQIELNEPLLVQQDEAEHGHMHPSALLTAADVLRSLMQQGKEVSPVAASSLLLESRHAARQGAKRHPLYGTAGSEPSALDSATSTTSLRSGLCNPLAVLMAPALTILLQQGKRFDSQGAINSPAFQGKCMKGLEAAVVRWRVFCSAA